jgi:hypothetical protein
MTVTATDADVPPQTVTFSIVGGTDQSKFGITSGGLLSFTGPPNFEAPTDANGDNVYLVTVQANDGNGGMATQSISVIVTPVNDNAPVFTSSDVVNVAENTTAVLTVSAADADLPSQTIAYSIAGGSDQSKFSITSAGVLSFKSPPDFESPTDANADNLYLVIVQVSDGSLTNLQAILVTVTNLGEAALMVGDFNNNAVVDTADYVSWRNGGPLENEGDTPGVVNQADYDVWRANFGRTTPAASAALFAQESELDSIALATPTFGEPNTRHVLAIALLIDPYFESTSWHVDNYRPVKRAVLMSAELQDDALITWLALRTEAAQHEFFADDFDDVPNNPDSVRWHDQPIDSLDSAFAELEGTAELLMPTGEVFTAALSQKKKLTQSRRERGENNGSPGATVVWLARNG